MFEKKLGNQVAEELLKPILYVTDNAQTLKLEKFKTPYVIKSNHSSGLNYFVRKTPHDKKYEVSTETDESSIMSSEQIIKNCKMWLDTKYGIKRYEWSYANINPKIFIEPFLSGVLGDRLTDVRLFCFHGRPEYVQIDLHLNNKRRTSILDRNFEELDVKYGSYQQIGEGSLGEIKKSIPEDLVISYAELMSIDFEFCRVDFLPPWKG